VGAAYDGALAVSSGTLSFAWAGIARRCPVATACVAGLLATPSASLASFYPARRLHYFGWSHSGLDERNGWDWI